MLAGIAACGVPENRTRSTSLPDSTVTHWQPLTDSGAAVYVEFGYNAAGNDSVKWGNAEFSRIEKLSSLTGGRAYEYPPQLLWQNNDFVCLMTNADGPFSEHLFLPAERAASPRFFASDIEYIDTTFNFVLTIDSVSENGNTHCLYWKISSLPESESLTFSTLVQPNCTVYPWHGEIRRNGERVIIDDCVGKTATEVAIRQFLADKACVD
ncbi:MAG: hypothetical protein IM638_05410 [Bacteroidetes bacterium]|nr:hypothetical protein [Bacteroidota bacterium]